MRSKASIFFSKTHLQLFTVIPFLTSFRQIANVGFRVLESHVLFIAYTRLEEYACVARKKTFHELAALLFQLFAAGVSVIKCRITIVIKSRFVFTGLNQMDRHFCSTPEKIRYQGEENDRKVFEASSPAKYKSNCTEE